MTAIESALAATFDPLRLLILTAGVFLGLIIGIIPGVGGLLGLVVLVPLTYHLDPFAAIALLLGLASVTTTSDTIPAVLLGVPGTGGAITTIEDGHPLAQQNQAARAFGAAYLASLIGGVFGALVLAASIPFMRPLITAMKTPDFLAVSFIGLLFVSFVSGRDGLKGLAAVMFGLLLSFVGLDPFTGVERYTGNQLFLLDGLPLAPVFLGLFGLSELAGLLRRGAIASGKNSDLGMVSMMTGFRDTLREWWLVIRCSSIGAVVGAIPGIGVTVIDWIAYGVATRNRRGGPPYGEGNIRGVIAPESANNAKEGGYLIPTIAFGIPGSAQMTILLAAFTVQGLVPGPDMLTDHLDVTYSMVFFIAIANVIGAATCIAFTPQLSRIATVPAAIVVPVALVFISLGAFHISASYESTILLVVFGIVGMVMKARQWPRAAVALGFILGPSVERYFFLSYQLSGFEWLLRPSIILTGVAATVLAWRAVTRWRTADRSTRPRDIAEPVSFAILGTVAALACAQTAGFGPDAGLFPRIVAGLLLLAVLALFVRYVRSNPAPRLPGNPRVWLAGLRPEATIVASCAIMAAGIYVVGFGVAVFAFIAGFAVLHDRTTRTQAVLVAGSVLAIVWFVFDRLVAVPWPNTVLSKLLSH